jgi:hypothetical protein
MNLNEECLLQYLKESALPSKHVSRPTMDELEALRPVFRRKKFVSFPLEIILKKIHGFLT